jgi:hypothetical protein
MDLADGGNKIDMKRKWNWPIWIGFIITVGGLFSYEFFAQFPMTRDFPWANLLLFAAGGFFLVLGLFLAFGKPQLYRGKIFGPILTTLGVLIFGFFSYLIFYELRQVPPSTGAPRVGEKALTFTLLDENDKPVSLADLLSSRTPSTSTARANEVLLIFYRGFW